MPTYKKEVWWIKTPFMCSLQQCFEGYIYHLLLTAQSQEWDKRSSRDRIFRMISRRITAAEQNRRKLTSITCRQNIKLNMDCAFQECSVVWFCSVRVLFCFVSFAVYMLHYDLSHFNGSIYNKNMGKFASLLISAQCAVSCVLANKMDVDWVDFIRKNSKIMFQLCPSIVAPYSKQWSCQ